MERGDTGARGRERCYAWAAVPKGLTAPDRSYILRRILRERDGAPVPERRSFLRSSSARVDGDDRRAEMLFWLGVPANFNHAAAAEHGVELLAGPSVASAPELPEGVGADE